MKLRKEELQNLCLSSNTSMRSAEYALPFRKIRNPGQQNKATPTTKRINSDNLKFCPKIYRKVIKNVAS